MQFKKSNLSKETLVNLYAGMLQPRMIEEKMLNLLRQGRVSKWFSGIGQEAIAVGATMALESDEYIFPMHRNLGVFTSRKMPLAKLFMQLQGKLKGYTKGRDRSFHFGSKEHHIVGMISHLGPQLTLANGIAMANLIENNNKLALAFTGEGGTSQGDFHEALNVAAVWQLPVIFLVENNGYGLSTPSSQQFRNPKLSDRGKGYGMKAITIDGNNILEVYEAVSKIKAEIKKKPQPYLLECMTFRMRGHEEASGVKYVPKKLISEWAKKDPLENYERYLLRNKVISKKDIDKFRDFFKSDIEANLEKAFAEPLVEAKTKTELADVFELGKHNFRVPKSPKKSKDLRLVDAISNGLEMAMKKHKKLILMGQDIAEYGGVFKITDGFLKKFGQDRVRNTPLCESAIIGAAVGLSIRGFKSMIEMQFSDFVTCGFNQIVNNAAKLHYRWGQNVDVVIRMPTGAGVGAGPFHSQSTEAWFYHVPGLKIVYPSNPYDAKGLLLAAFEDPNPVLYFEHKAMYRGINGEVPNEYYTIPFGKAALVSEGNDITIVCYGLAVQWAKEYMDEQDLSADILDLRTLNPIDWESITASVKKTGKVIVLHEATTTGGIGGDIAAYISEHCFEYLDGPVKRLGSLDTPVPFAAGLEENFFPIERFKEVITELLEY